jgi:hypothetical protein
VENPVDKAVDKRANRPAADILDRIARNMGI